MVKNMGNRSLEEVLQQMSLLGASIEPLMYDFLLKGINKDFKDLIKWQTSTGGKRLRPALTLVFAKAFGAATDDYEVKAAAAGIELIHTYSLILDDIIDRGDLRRGKPTTRAKYGDEFAILSGIIHREAVFEAARGTGKHFNSTIGIFSETIRALTEGERLDVLFEQKEDRTHKYFQTNRFRHVSFRDYRRMIAGKTAALIAAACKLGALVGGASLEEQACAEKFGWATGIAFQIADDYLDLFATADEFGKVVYKDIIEQKLGNFAIVKTFEKLSQEDSKLLHTYLTSSRLTDDERVSKSLPLIEKANIKEEVLQEAEKWAKKAEMVLRTISLKDEDLREVLEKMTEFSVRRAF